MLAIEKQIRDFYRQYYEFSCQEILKDAGNSPLLKKLAITSGLIQAKQELEDESPERKQMREIANEYGISVNLIDDEEYQRALSFYQ